MCSAQKRRRLLFVCAFVILAALTPFWVGAQSGEMIDSFRSDITINTDGSVILTEEIVYDFGANERHGIFRYIPTKHPQEASVWYKHRFIGYEVQSVLRDGVPEPYELEESGEEFRIRIGDPEYTLNGKHTYEIALLLRGALSYGLQEGGAELYFNVTGNGWEVPIRNVEAIVRTQGDMRTENSACYQGGVGETNRCTIEERESALIFSTADLDPGEGMTIAQALNAQSVARQVEERIAPIVFLLPLLFLAGAWLIYLCIYVYRFKIFYRPKGAIIAEYEPYPGVLPMYTGVLIDDRLDSKDVAAGIVYLAEQGYFKIRKIDRKVLFFIEVDDYEVTLLRLPEAAMPESARELITLFFSVEKQVVGATVKLSGIHADAEKQKENFQIITALASSSREELKKAGFYESQMRKKLIALWGVTIALTALTIFLFFVTEHPFSFVPLAVLVVAAILLLLGNRRLTDKGYRAVYHLKGFKQFLSVTDKERFAFHNAPEKSPEVFMEYLPYAIAFGVEKEWAQVFKEVTLPQPGWYDGGSSGAFSAIALTNSLNGFSSTLATSAGTSGSSGGGASGGGGGGGGGGSW